MTDHDRTWLTAYRECLGPPDHWHATGSIDADGVG